MDEKQNISTEDYPQEKAQPQDMPKSTIWPPSLAFGILFLMVGFITSGYISAIGILIMIISITGWINDLKP
jgi:hypothetical protein